MNCVTRHECRRACGSGGDRPSGPAMARGSFGQAKRTRVWCAVVSAAPAAPEPRAWSRTDTGLLVALALATLVVRLITLRTIDLGGDATFKWFFVRSWQYANPWIFDHHTARFSINVPTWLVQRCFGSHPNGMYVTPLMAAVAQVPLLYGSGRALGSRAIGTLACLLLLPFEPAIDSASQLLPGIFQATYVLGASYSLLRFAAEPEPRRRWLIAAAAWFFAAYLAMVTTVYVLPGAALAVWLVRRSARDVSVLFGALAGLIALETLGYALFSPYPFGQFQMILHTHTDVKPTGFLGLFGRYAVLPRDWQAVLAGWLVAALAYAGWLRRHQLQGPQRASADTAWLLPTTALGGMTFGVKGLDPIIPATDFSIRYFDVLIPMVALCIALALHAAVRRGLESRALPYPSQLAAAATMLAVLASTALAIALYRPARNALAITDTQWRTLNDAFERNLPIVGSNRSEHFQRKTLTCIQWGYLSDALLLDGGELKLRDLGKTQVGQRIHRFISRTELSPEDVKAAIKARHCLVTVRRDDSEPKLAISVYDGPDCPQAPSLRAF